MTHRKYETFKMYLSFESDIERIEEEIKKIPTQTSGGHSKIGYMSSELENLKNDLLEVTKKHRQNICKDKEIL